MKTEGPGTAEAVLEVLDGGGRGGGGLGLPANRTRGKPLVGYWNRTDTVLDDQSRTVSGADVTCVKAVLSESPGPEPPPKPQTDPATAPEPGRPHRCREGSGN